MRVFQRMQTVSATIKGLEVMRTARGSHRIVRAPEATAEIRLVSQPFGFAA
ncbi:hypothetical protein [Microvirga sp. G4-2]|uniref:hypothetical protein n=1 Tax=Microvirga sp. G4-2 TaxID=3434467 RepID=UPI004043A3DA